MAGVSTCVGLARTSSIDFEPKTLDFHQIQYAREAALYIMNTKSMDEAFNIFTVGLEPVTSAQQGRTHNQVQQTPTEREEAADFDDNDEDEEEEEGYNNSLSGLQRFRDASTWPL